MLLGRNFDFLAGYLVVTVRYLVLTARYCLFTLLVWTHIDWSHEKCILIGLMKNAYWLVSWRSNSIWGKITFTNKVHIVNSTCSGFSRKTACVFLSWSKLENVCVCIYCLCHFTFILNLSFLMLKTSPVISSGNSVVFKSWSSSFSKSLSCPPVGGTIITTSADPGLSSWVWFTALDKKRYWVRFP